MTRQAGPSRPVLAMLDARSSGHCERAACTNPAEQTHHRRPRGMGGSKDPKTNLPANLLRLCAECHAWIESNRVAAHALGLLVSQGIDPAEVPLQLRGVGKVLLDNVGGWHDIEPRIEVAW